MTAVNRSGERCVRCGEVAVGSANTERGRLCHGDEQRPSCYELEVRARVTQNVPLGSLGAA